MDRAKTAVSSFDKQVEGIGKKFSTSFKDIFLSFLGPMALLGAVMGFIGKLIADNQKKQEEANQAAIDGTNKLMSAEDQYWANKRNNEKKAEATVEEAATARENTTRQFLEEDPRGKQMFDQALVEKTFGQPFRKYHGPIAGNPEIQAKVQALISADMKAAGASAGDVRGTPFKSPEGFSNVVGVGANPVMEAMAMQLEETRRQTALLEIIARPAGGGVPVDFTKVTDSSPSRASMLSSK